VIARMLLLVAFAAGLPACSERDCRALKQELLSRYDPYADRCRSTADCGSRSCDRAGTGVCRCDRDDQCGSGSCRSGLCANPGHDRRLTADELVAAPGPRVDSICERFLPAERVLNAEPACRGDTPTSVFALLEDADCPVCDEAALLLCGCLSGAGLHDCLVALATDRDVAGGAPDDEDSETLCEDQVARLRCTANRMAAGALCGSDGECQSGACVDDNPSNNETERGDDPRDWRCAKVAAPGTGP